MKNLLTALLILTTFALNAQSKATKNDTVSFGGQSEKMFLALDEQQANFNNPKWIEEQKQNLAEKKAILLNTFLESKGKDLSKTEIIGYLPGKLITKQK